MTPTSALDQYRSVRQASQTLGVTYQYTLDLIHAGKLASTRAPWGMILVDAASVQSYAQQRAARRPTGVSHG